MRMVPSVAKAFSKSISTYRSVQYASQTNLQSYAPYLLRQPALTPFKEFRAVNLPKNK
jgi:hypothetical protein